MELSPPQYDDLYDALHGDFTPASLGRMLRDHANRRLEDIVSPTEPYQKIVEEVLKRAELEKWTWDLIRAALTANPKGKGLMAFIKKHPFYNPANPRVVPDPYRTPYVLAKQILIDREALSAALEELQMEDGPRVLVVTGEESSGKTYSRELIYYVANSFNPNHVVVYVDLDKDVREPDALAEAIVGQMGQEYTVIPEREQDQKMRYSLRLSNWITTHVRNGGPATTYWFIFDGFKKTPITETRGFIEDLSIQVQTRLRQCRVVLLNYNELLPPDIRGAVGKEHIGEITRRELVSFFERVNQMHGSRYESVELEEKVDVIIKEVEDAILTVEDAQKRRLELLNAAVSRAVKVLFH